MPHSRSLSEQSCLLSNADFSHQDGDRSRLGLPYTFPSQHKIHFHHDPESALPPRPSHTPIQHQNDTISREDLPNKRQLLIFSLCRFSSSLSNILVLPYLFHLVRSAVSTSSTPSLAADNDDIVTYYTSIPTTALVSIYAGVLVAAFPLAQLLVSILSWNRYGQRLPIVWSLAISAVANLAFGFSRSFGALLLWRTVSGLASGNGGVMRRVASEIVGEGRKYQDKACQVLSMVGNLGMVAGLAMGGLLAEPVKTMPGFFGAEGVLNRSGSEEGVKWMVKYPFALPAVVNAVLLGLMAMAAAAWLRETMSGQDQVESGTGYSTRRPYILLNDTENLLSDRHQEKPPAKTSLRSALTTRTLPSLISSFLLALHTSAFAFILPLHLSTPSSPYSPLLSYSSHSLVPILFRFSGGLALSPVTISLYLSLFGLLGLLFRAFVYHWWQNRLSTMGLFELSLAVFPFVYLLTPYLSLFSWGHQDTDRTTGCAIMMKWIALGIVVGGQTLATSMVGPSAKVLLAESAPSEGVRERVQEVGNMVATLASVVGPVVGGVVYAKGVREEVVGAAWWFYLVVVAVVAAAWCVGVQGRVNEESETDEIDVSDFGYVKTSDRGW